MSRNIRVRNNTRLRVFSKEMQRTYTTALNDCLDDLVRTSSQSAPHDEGVLEKSWTKETNYTGTELTGTVSFSVTERGGSGNFNYALKMHDGYYNLGDKSKQKSGGTGMSGRTYPVGRDFLGGVLRGEKQTYIKHIEQACRQRASTF